MLIAGASGAQVGAEASHTPRGEPMNPACPVCSSRLQLKQLDFRAPFRCPVCGCSLRISPLYAWTGSIVALLLVSLCMSWVGARGYQLLAGIALAFAPVCWGVFVIQVAIAPPTVEVTGPPSVTAPRSVDDPIEEPNEPEKGE